MNYCQQNGKVMYTSNIHKIHAFNFRAVIIVFCSSGCKHCAYKMARVDLTAVGKFRTDIDLIEFITLSMENVLTYRFMIRNS